MWYSLLISSYQSDIPRSYNPANNNITKSWSFSNIKGVSTELLKVPPKSKCDQFFQHLVFQIENDVQQCASAHKAFDDFTEFGLTTKQDNLGMRWDFTSSESTHIPVVKQYKTWKIGDVVKLCLYDMSTVLFPFSIFFCKLDLS